MFIWTTWDTANCLSCNTVVINARRHGYMIASMAQINTAEKVGSAHI